MKFGLDVVSISRSGAPNTNQPWKSKVKWVSADIGENIEWADELKEASAVVSCLGAFGSDEFMERVNGDYNIKVVSEAIKAGVSRFVYVSTVENNLPSFVLRGYFNGKRRAEEAVLDGFPDTGTILRPGFMYGDRQVGPVTLPLGIVGRPLQSLLSLPGASTLQSLPGMKALLASPLPVQEVGLVAAAAAAGRKDLSLSLSGVLRVEDIQLLAKMLSNK
eukprot:CAMPEP_0182419654 /NCGR_PEP_ID=MMETSP1167-20130531/4060_1 /TAXON_ID=2988 /ORGANISM="Mallomonas Sp, Strain CCMP3275" /LENGTH=218 /DNA_ID=CAMNT_0024594687 /DNA_START=134 /DNA_END=790 /DNA_ORIENTATION=-